MRYPCTAQGNAQRFADKYGTDFRFDAAKGIWLTPDGSGGWEKELVCAAESCMRSLTSDIWFDFSQSEDNESKALHAWAITSESDFVIQRSLKIAQGLLQGGVK